MTTTETAPANRDLYEDLTDEARELILYGENHEPCYLSGRKISIDLQKRHDTGRYTVDRAAMRWKGWAREVAAAYARECRTYGGKPVGSQRVYTEVAEWMERTELDLMKTGEYRDQEEA